MDKRKVITAYQNGLLTLQECAQILGVERYDLIQVMEVSPQRQTSVAPDITEVSTPSLKIGPNHG